VNGFLGSAIIETALGVAFVYLLLAVFCTAMVEWIANLLATRAATLRSTIAHLLRDQMLPGDSTFLAAFYGHPIISALTKGDEHPVWLSARSFSTAILDLSIAPENNPEKCVLNLPEGELRTALVALLRKGEGNFAHLQAGLEHWFDDAMQRASSSYQKQTRTWTFVIAVAVTVATNADTLQLLRQPGHLPGWATSPIQLNLSGWLARLTGWILTVGAVSLGAPFWFDVLNRFVNLRYTGRPPQFPEKPSH
jgi:hypothetical protein